MYKMQDKALHTDYWLKSAQADIEAMNIMLSARQNHWALFIGHLVIEKVLKAIYVQNQDNPIPRIHDLSRLAELAGVTLSDETSEKLDVVTTFNIRAKYPDYKDRFYHACTSEYTELQATTIKDLYQWLKTFLKHN
jgi:HEPN domain-containing protein